MYLGQGEGSLGERIRAEIEAEARSYIEDLFGRVYEAIPDSVKRRVEREYISRRLEEERARILAAGKDVRAAGIAVLGGLAALLLLRGKRR